MGEKDGSPRDRRAGLTTRGRRADVAPMKNGTGRLSLRAIGVGALVAFTALACSKVEMDPIPEAELDAKRQASAQAIGTRILTEWAKDEYKPLGDEAREEFRKAHNDVDAQRTADKQIEGALGTFQSMTFSQALRTKDKKAEVYRFKGVFDKASDPAEVRVVLDDQGRLSGFWVKPWKDTI